jgi:CheY-like chemotaxis protein
MPTTILIAIRDLTTLHAIGQALGREHHVVCTQHGREALELVTNGEITLAIIDTELIDMSGLDLLRALGPYQRGCPCLFITRLGYEATIDEVIRLGVTYCIEQPLTMGLFLSFARRAIADRSNTSGTAVRQHSFVRWADLIVPVVTLPNDVRTLEEWARATAVSVGALRNWCRTAGLPSRRSLLLARSLRAVILRMSSSASPADLLNIVDRRTLSKMLLEAGGTSTDLPSNADEFLKRQQFVTNGDAIDTLRTALALAGFLPNQVSGDASLGSVHELVDNRSGAATPPIDGPTRLRGLRPLLRQKGRQAIVTIDLAQGDVPKGLRGQRAR